MAKSTRERIPNQQARAEALVDVILKMREEGEMPKSLRPDYGPARSTKAALDPGAAYPGGKGQSGLHQWIVDLLPSHVFYCEPFAGKGAVFRHKVPAMRSLLIDKDPFVIAWWHRQTRLWSIDRRLGEISVRNALSSLVSSDVEVPGVKSDAGGLAGFRRRASSAASATRAIVGDGIQFLEAAAAGDIDCSELLVYCDPPYLPSTRTKLKMYAHEMSAKDHCRLLTALVNFPGPAMISGYLSDLYVRRLQAWRLETREVVTRGLTKATECLWVNPAARLLASSPLALQYSRLGNSCRDRQRVDRLCKRWVAKFQSRTPRERRALILALLDHERAACSSAASDCGGR